MKKNSITTMIVVMLIYGISMMLTGCKGDQGDIGPAGADGTNGIAGINGTDGTNGVAGNVTCLICHSANAKNLIAIEFANSQHSIGDIAVSYAGGRGSCGPCHGHEQYVEYALTGSSSNCANPSAWKCNTCHDLHNTFEEGDYAFRMDDAITLVADGTTIIDAGNNNVCMRCHQARKDIDDYIETTDETYTRTFTSTDDIAAYTNASVGPGGSVTDYSPDSIVVVFVVPTASHIYINSTHAGAHHGPQGNIWFGIGGSETGSAYSSHSGSCVECHMGSASGHSFIPEEGNCTGCHATKETEMAAIAARIQVIGEALEAIHAIHYDDGWHPMYASLSIDEFNAFFNFMICMEDRSNSAHNPTYVKALLTQAENALSI